MHSIPTSYSEIFGPSSSAPEIELDRMASGPCNLELSVPEILLSLRCSEGSTAWAVFTEADTRRCLKAGRLLWDAMMAEQAWTLISIEESVISEEGYTLGAGQGSRRWINPQRRHAR
jgi:hypothetical protein